MMGMNMPLPLPLPVAYHSSGVREGPVFSFPSNR